MNVKCNKIIVFEDIYQQIQDYNQNFYSNIFVYEKAKNNNMTKKGLMKFREISDYAVK